MALWTCEICNLTMSMNDQSSHISGKRHVAQASGYTVPKYPTTDFDNSPRLLTKITPTKLGIHNPAHSNASGQTASTRKRPIRPMATQAKNGIWKCTVCDREMQQIQRDEHLKGKAHGQMTNADGNRSITTQDASQSTSETSNPSYMTWICQLCCLRMPESYQNNHLRGAAHLHNLAINGEKRGTPISHSPIKVATSSPAGPTLWRCQICDREMQQISREDHLAGKPHADVSRKELFAKRKKSKKSKKVDKPLSVGPLDAFFYSYLGSQHDPSLPPATAYKRLKEIKRWHRNDPEGEEAWHGYRVALVGEFNRWYGTEDDLASWHSLCRAIHITPLPMSIEACRSVSRRKIVNSCTQLTA